jgi:light-regulated signal transduction histidine kinase (bacteriophytochrome)
MEDHLEKLDAEGRDYLRRVQAAAQRMGELIEGLLGLARLARREMYRESVDLSALAGLAAQTQRQSDPNREVEFSIAEGARAEGDRQLLEIALQNLLANAWKFTSKQPSAHIEFGVRGENGQTVYFVRDNGAGFDMAYAANLFGAFQRLHTQDEFEGHGIGLATVQRVIRRHGGRIWAEGEVGKGATFSFTL